MRWRLPPRAARVSGDDIPEGARLCAERLALAARPVPPDADDVASGIPEECDPQVALRVTAPEDRMLAHGWIFYPEPARRETNAATSRICFGLNCPANDGIPPPPERTLETTASKPGRAESRFGPI